MRERLAAWGSEKLDGLTLGDLAIAVGTRLTMVPLVVRRVDDRLHGIGALLQSEEAEVEACLQDRAAYRHERAPWPAQKAAVEGVAPDDAEVDYEPTA